MSALLASLAGAAITAPHLLRLEHAHPATAAAIWLAAVCLRALVAFFVVLSARPRSREAAPAARC